MNDNITPHIHAEVIKAWADGHKIEKKRKKQIDRQKSRQIEGGPWLTKGRRRTNSFYFIPSYRSSTIINALI